MANVILDRFVHNSNHILIDGRGFRLVRTFESEFEFENGDFEFNTNYD